MRRLYATMLFYLIIETAVLLILCSSVSTKSSFQTGVQSLIDISEDSTRLPRSSNKYCSLSWHHTLCQHSGIGPNCRGGATHGGVTEAEKWQILTLHNHLRSKVATGLELRGPAGRQPPAADMSQLVWDDELAAVAQSHADQCLFEHDCSECRRVKRFPVGQNLYMSYTTGRDLTGGWEEAVGGWYSEVKAFPNTYIDPFTFKHSTGHYSQMLWATTTHVGCGFRSFQEGIWNKKLFTCNYGPAGNVITLPMYIVGPPCSRCPNGFRCSTSYAGLCQNNLSEIQDTNHNSQFDLVPAKRASFKDGSTYENGYQDPSVTQWDELGGFQDLSNAWGQNSYLRSEPIPPLNQRAITWLEPWNTLPFRNPLPGEVARFEEPIILGNNDLNRLISSGFSNSVIDGKERDYYRQFSDLRNWQDPSYADLETRYSESGVDNFIYDFFGGSQDFSGGNVLHYQPRTDDFFTIDAYDFY